MNLQAELAYTQARISTLQRAPFFPLPPPPSDLFSFSGQSEETSLEMVSFCNSSVDQDLEDAGDDLHQSLALEYVSRYFPGVRFRPPTNSQ